MILIRILCRRCDQCDVTAFKDQTRFPSAVALIACVGLAIHAALLAESTAAPSIALTSFVLGAMSMWLSHSLYVYIFRSVHIARAIKARTLHRGMLPHL